jgi:hypothetical protein
MIAIKRGRFEKVGGRTIELSRGMVTWPDLKVCRFNVRLIANPGSDGDIYLVAEDINTGVERTLKLSRQP